VTRRLPRWTVPVTLTLAVLGLADSAYLTYVHFTGVQNLVCGTGGTIDCAAVTTSAQSEIFGIIPVSVTGLAYYVLVVALMTPWAWRQQRLRLPRVAVSVAGMAMVFYLLYAELVQIGKICEYCTGVHIITFLLLVAVLVATFVEPLPTIEELLDDSGPGGSAARGADGRERTA
jgi:uncharacterized membrane protein